MRYILAIWVIIVLVGLLVISLINLAENGTSGMILAGISAFALYRVFKFVFTSEDPDSAEESRASSGNGIADPLEYMIYGDITRNAEPEDWED
jgi:uncharacterized membrane protein